MSDRVTVEGITWAYNAGWWEPVGEAREVYVQALAVGYELVQPIAAPFSTWYLTRRGAMTAYARLRARSER